jgi:hypothetical protein
LVFEKLFEEDEEKNFTKCFNIVSGRSTVVERLSHRLNVTGSSPATVAE